MTFACRLENEVRLFPHLHLQEAASSLGRRAGGHLRRTRSRSVENMHRR